MNWRLPNDEHGSEPEGRFIAFWATGKAGNAKGRKIALPALPYSRSAALESLLSVALSSAVQFAFYHPAFFMPKMALFSKLKWACFRC
jgi:hypothetical protein